MMPAKGQDPPSYPADTCKPKAHRRAPGTAERRMASVSRALAAGFKAPRQLQVHWLLLLAVVGD